MSDSSQNTKKRTNPFNSNSRSSSSTSSSSSPFSGGSSRSSSSSNSSSSSSRVGSLRSRLSNAQVVEWTVRPLNNTVIRFNLHGLGDPFHRLLGTELNLAYGDPQKIATALQDDDLYTQLADVLDAAWDTYGLQGAILLYPWEETVRKALTQPPLPAKQKKEAEKEEGSEEETDNTSDTDAQESDTQQGAIQCLRAIDPALVLNILARVRSNMIVEGTPLALEPDFLDKTWLCDDPRIVAVTYATGCIEEAWQ